MREDLFSVSVKGVLGYNHQYLLRKNQRKEYELLGGRLEASDVSIQHRLRVEFLEESQIMITDIKPREPWLYICGINNIIIIPYTCKVYKNEIPKDMNDLDGGELQWFYADDLNVISLPQGYRDTIFANIPHKTYSSYVGKYPKLISNYKETFFKIRINLFNVYQTKLISKYLPHFCSPRELLKSDLGEYYNINDIVSIEPSCSEDTIEINYVYIGR